FDIAVLENRFPAFGRGLRIDDHPAPPPSEGCEVVIYTPDHDQTFAQLSLAQVKKLIEVWTERYLELGARSTVQYVYIFENKGEEMGVTLQHPHGQIYAMPFIPPVAAAEMEASAGHLSRTGHCLHCAEIKAEQSSVRVIHSNRHTCAFIPRAARWPYEVHLYPTAHRTSLAELSTTEREEFARALLLVTRAYDRHFGFSTPYVMAMHQAPTDGVEHAEAHLHVEFYPPHRRPDRLKYLAGVELGAGTFVNDTLPENTAADLAAAISELDPPA
ncbi:MAG TPA: galactose-1-phosphate uridylyltransferase, partial [Candidatus Dormibacteraeota bacterium]|nr:galactose-1-phosphate uridylyltransferase [Candidatus Dormibacteraeota bacterium]